MRLAAVILQIDPLSNSAGQLLLLDEPMSSLDVAQQAALDRLLHEAERGGDCGGDEQPRSQPYPAPRRSELAALLGEAIACGETAEVLNEEKFNRPPMRSRSSALRWPVILCSSRHSSTQLSCHYIDKQAKLLR